MQTKLVGALSAEYANQDSAMTDAFHIIADENGVRSTLDLLPHRQATALRLRYLEGRSVEDVAKTLGATYSATESILARGRRRFADVYANR